MPAILARNPVSVRVGTNSVRVGRRAVLLLVLLGVAAPVSSLGEEPSSDLARGVRQVEEGDLEGAVVTLKAALVQLAGERSEQKRARAHLYLAIAHLGLDQQEEARAHMLEAWTNDKKMKLDRKLFAPRVVQLFESVKREAERAQGTRARDVKKAERKAPPGLIPAVAGAGLGTVAGLTLGGAETKTTSPVTPAPMLSPPVTTNLRVFNCDDLGRAFVNGAPVVEVGLGQDSGLLDVTDRLREGSNEIVFELVNLRGGITYAFQVRRGDAIVFQETCGLVLKVGCEDDRRFPEGVVRRFVYTLEVARSGSPR